MARNATRNLTTDEARTVAEFSPILFATVGDGEAYTVGYVNSRGEHGMRTGRLHTVQGTDSTLSFKVEDAEGPRTINVRSLISVTHA